MEDLFGDSNAFHADSSTITVEDPGLSQSLYTGPPCPVLVVDDDELVRARLSALLKGFHYDIQVAASGEQALQVIEESQCRIVLTDWQMPDMDGLTLCRHVRNSHDDGYVYILMLTVRNAKEDILTGLAAGADDYIVKGAPIRELIARLEVARRITQVEQSFRIRDRETHRLSHIDSLTGAHNLRYLAEHLPRELGRSQRYGHSLAVLSCEIDELKLIIDRFGRPAGEDVLREFVARCQGSIRTASDWLARVGEGEFMIVLPETAARGAHRVAQKLRQILAMEPVSTRAGSVSVAATVTVTAMEPQHELDAAVRIRDMLSAADRGNSSAMRMKGGNEIH
ncbi:MAG TPA: response regulator [Steroidobacteraceae bacterium]